MEHQANDSKFHRRNRKVQVLPPHVVEQIAAGEVVERPASVLKELIENSLDAGAETVVVKVARGGLSFLEVSDDGCGMDPEDALEALKRHATSKIRTIEDLSNITTLGFRGEALSSIAAVSSMEIITRPGHSQEATRIVVESGVILEVSPWGAPVGTRVRVEKLFNKVPARRKFLRSEVTEGSHVREVFLQLAMAYPSVRFEFYSDERVRWELPPRESWEQRVKDIFGEEAFKELYLIQEKEELVEVEGFMSHPNFHRGTASDIRLYVNRRSVQDRGLLGAVLRAYGQLLPRGRYPVGVISLKMPAKDLDVNVHPTKKEVRFRDPRRIQELVFAAVRKMLKIQPWLPWEMRLGVAPAVEYPSSFVSESISEENEGVKSPSERPEQGYLPFTVGDPRDTRASWAEVRYLGQVGRTYLVFATQEGLLIVDQHAAHERVIMEEMRNALERDGIPGQGVLEKVLLELTPEEEKILGLVWPVLEKLGWNLEPFGKGCWRLHSVPPWVGTEEAVECMKEILQTKGTADELLPEEVLSRSACLAASKAGKEFSAQEAKELLAKVRGVDSKGLCPHGRPTFLEITISELHRRFSRG